MTPDGMQYRCGAHAVARAEPTGHVQDGVIANIRGGLPSLKEYPAESCRKCALATLFINQAIDQKLAATVAEWSAAEAAASGPTA